MTGYPMRLTQLEYFVRTANLGSTNAAAAELHVTQPAVSTAIRNLEKELGTPLFRRRRQRLELTEAGALFYRRVNNVLNELHAAVKEVEGYSPDQKNLRLGIPPMIGTIYMPAILRKFVPAHPKIHLEVNEANTMELSQMLGSQKIDMALVIGESPYTRGFERQELLQTQYSFFVGRDDPLAKQKRVTIQQLAKEPLMLFDTGLFLNQYITDAFRTRKLADPNIIFASSQINSIKKYVSMSLGGTFLIRECVRESDGLVEVPTEITPTISIAACWVRGTTLPAAGKTLLRFLQKISPNPSSL